MPRPALSIASAALYLAFYSFLALAMLLGTGLLCAGVIGLIYNGPVLTPGNLSVGLACGLIVWLFVATFHLRNETVTLPAADADRFMQEARLLLKEMGYDVKSHGHRQLSTRPRFHSLLFGGSIQVVWNGSRATLTGPKVCIELLRNRLRIQAHLSMVQRAMRERHRFTETLIQRVELRLRVKPEQLADVCTHVIEVLQARSEVICELSLLAQSDQGIPESILEFQVNEWLEDQGIESTLHKHFVQLHRPLGSTELVLRDAV